MPKFQPFIELLKNKELNNHSDAYQAFCLIADGRASTSQIKEFLLLINKNGVDEILLFAAVKALDERSVKIKAPEDTIDVCGTGGDNSNSLNISTTVAIILSSLGVPVAKHGNKAVSSKSGSADIFSELGININQTKEEIEHSLEENRLAFIFAPNFHPALKNVAEARKEIGQEFKSRTIFNFLGPLLNPAQVKYQLIGYSDEKIAEKIINFLYLLDKKRCWIVTGLDGMDEISISSNTMIRKFDGQNPESTSKTIFNPKDYDFKKRDIKLIEGKDARYNASKLIQLLKNEIDDEKMQAYKDVVILNSAAALIVAGKFDNFFPAIAAIKEQIESKKSYNFLQRFIKN